MRPYERNHLIIAGTITALSGIIFTPVVAWAIGSGFYFFREVYQAFRKGKPYRYQQHFSDWGWANLGATIVFLVLLTIGR